MELKTIKTQTTWQEAVDALNANSQTIQIEFEKASKFLGYYVSLGSLISAHETGKIGDFAYVGTTAPFAIYAWDGNSQWYDTGATGGSDEVDLSGFVTNEGGTIDGDLLINGDVDTGGALNVANSVTANAFVVRDKTSNDILLGDGSTLSIDEVGSLKATETSDINEYEEIWQ